MFTHELAALASPLTHGRRRFLKASGIALFGFWLMTSPALAKDAKSAAQPKTQKGDAVTTAQKNPVVVFETSLGTFEIELNSEKAPLSAANFLKYVDDGFYSGTIFHRVIPDFMIQGGGFTESMSQKPTREPIKNEASNGLKNLRGTVAMARTSDINSATAQFFVNTVDNGFLDHRNTSPSGYGYAVFGKVVSGMDVIDKIRAVPTANKGMHENVPVTPVVIKSAKQK